MLKKEKNKKINKEEMLSNFVFAITNNIASKKGLKIPEAYDKKFAGYYLQYCKDIGAKNVKNKTQALEQLNADFVKGVQGSVLPLVKKQRSINKSYKLFNDICASCRLQMKEKYGVISYYDLAYSKNKNAREEYENFEKWAEQTTKLFKNYKATTKEIIEGKGPQDFVNRSILLTLGFGALGAAAFGAGLFLDDDDIAATVLVAAIGFICLGAAIYFYEMENNEEFRFGVEEFGFNMQYEVDQIFQQYGFKDRHEGYDYINDYISVMAPEEKQALIDSIIENQQLETAHNYGFNSTQEAIDAATATAGVKHLSLNEALKIQSEKYSDVQNAIAKKYGFSDYDSAVNFLNSHKILKGEHFSVSGPGWSVYDYDDANASALAKEFGLLDSYQSNTVNSIKSQTWPQDVMDYGEYNSMMNEITSAQIFKQLCYEKMLSSDNYGYGVDNVSNMVYSDFVDKVGVENANYYAKIPTKPSNVLNSEVVASNSQSTILDNLDSLTIGLVGVGFTTTAAVRCFPGLKAILANVKGKKILKNMKARKTQMLEDESRLGKK